MSFQSEDTYTSGRATSSGVSEGNSVINPVADNFFSTLRTRSIVEPEFIYNAFPKCDNVPPKLEVDYSRILNKPFFIKNISWGTVDGRWSSISTINIPNDLLVNELTQYPFKTSVMYRAKISLIYQVAATPMHQGTILVTNPPMGFSDIIDNSENIVNPALAAPHAFLYANESTAVRVQVPFYVNGKMAMTNFNSDTILPCPYDGNYATSICIVQSPLACPTSAASSVTISVHAVFDELEFYVPHIDIKWRAESAFAPLGRAITKGADGLVSLGKTTFGDIFDGLRSIFRKYTGLHNPNCPNTQPKTIVAYRQNGNTVDSATSYEKLDPYSDYARITRDTIFDSSVDEMDMSHILSKPQRLGRFKVKTADATGTLLWSRPITPYQPTKQGTYYNELGTPVDYQSVTSLLAIFSSMSRFWKGSLNIHIQSNMTNFHFCKLELARNYSPVAEQFGNFPDYSSIQNLMVDTMEFSGGGQVQTIKLPFVSSMDMLPTTTDWKFNAAQHGMYYIYLAQPLVTNGAVPTEIEFSIYVSAGEDFQFYGYAASPLGILTSAVSEFKAQSATMQSIAEQAQVTSAGVISDPGPDDMMRPIVSVRDYLRRMYKVETLRYKAEDLNTYHGLVSIDVAEILGRRQFNSSLVNRWEHASPLSTISRMFLATNGGLKFKLVVTGATCATAWYVPPGFMMGSKDLPRMWNSSFPLPSDASDINYDYMSHQFTPVNLNSFSGGTKFNSPTPCIERANYINPISNEAVRSPDGELMLGGIILEGHVPNLTPFRFLGDGNQLYGHNLDIESYTATSDLGHIVLALTPPKFFAANVSDQPLDIHVAVHAGYDDEARMGYQVSVPRMFVPGFRQGEISYQVVPFCAPPGYVDPAMPPVTTIDLSGATSCYFG
jgi:hypothetical protein